MDMMSYSKKYSRLLLWGIFSFLVLTGNLLSGSTHLPVLASHSSHHWYAVLLPVQLPGDYQSTG